MAKPIIKDVDIQHKTLTGAGVVPTIPVPPTILPGNDLWKTTDILPSQLAYNTTDDKWFTRDENDVIQETARGGEVNTASNVGTGNGEVFKQKTGVDLELKTIKAGSNITVTNNANDITVAASGGSPGGVDTDGQYNNGGVFGGTNQKYNDATGNHGINKAPVAGEKVGIQGDTNDGSTDPLVLYDSDGNAVLRFNTNGNIEILTSAQAGISNVNKDGLFVNAQDDVWITVRDMGRGLRVNAGGLDPISTALWRIAYAVSTAIKAIFKPHYSSESGLGGAINEPSIIVTGVNILKAKSTGVDITGVLAVNNGTGLPVYANNAAAAASLPKGAFYRITGTDTAGTVW